MMTKQPNAFFIIIIVFIIIVINMAVHTFIINAGGITTNTMNATVNVIIAGQPIARNIIRACNVHRHSVNILLV